MTPCILWPYAKDKDGYGMVRYKGKMRGAHRLALGKKLGRDLAPSEWCLHTCHCPSCVNPDHLMVGDVAENNRQARSRRTSIAQTALGLP